MKRLKAIWKILTCDNFFLASYYNGFSGDYDEINYIHPQFNKYFADSINGEEIEAMKRLKEYCLRMNLRY